MIQISKRTDVGLVRKDNEDSIRVEQNQFKDQILIMADGMGGHNAGDIASSMACQIIGDLFINLTEPVDYEVFLQQAILEANKQIYQESLQHPDLNKMGTTTSILIYTDKCCYTGHIGDSRIYYINEEKISQITKDHTLVRAMVDSGSMLEGEQKYSKYKNVLLQALGTSKKITVEIKVFEPPTYFCFLLCSDGLTGEVTDEMIFTQMNLDEGLDYRVNSVVDLAKKLDGSDNISVIVLENRSLS